MNGTNGIEIGNVYDGAGVVVVGNTFRRNTSAGIYVGNGSGHVIRGNVFDDNLIGINVNGVLAPEISNMPIHVNAAITGNTFLVPAGEQNVHGIYALGSGAGGTIGGSGTDANTFEITPRACPSPWPTSRPTRARTSTPRPSRS